MTGSLLSHNLSNESPDFPQLASANSFDAKINGSPALRALSLFIKEYGWDKSLTSLDSNLAVGQQNTNYELKDQKEQLMSLHPDAPSSEEEARVKNEEQEEQDKKLEDEEEETDEENPETTEEEAA